MTMIPPMDDNLYDRPPRIHPLLREIRELQMKDKLLSGAYEEKMKRRAVLVLDAPFVAMGGGTPPMALPQSLEELLDHPDLPEDTEILCALAQLDLNFRLLLCSSEWEEVPEGEMGSSLRLQWRTCSDGEVRPIIKADAKPAYPPQRAARLKFVCIHKCLHEEGDGTANLEFEPVYSGSVENEEFWRWTPAGALSFSTINVGVASRFEEGQEYYIDITPAPKQDA